MANVSSSNGLEKRPKLRFPGFDEPWRAAQLGDLLIELSDYATQESGFPLLTSSRQGLFVQEDYFTDKQANAETTVFSVLPYGCITYRHMSDDNIFHFNINRLVANGLVSKEYPVFTVRKDVLDTDFLVDTLNSSPLFSVFCIQQKKGGTRTRLYFKTLCSYQMFLPALHEQQVIASFIRLLDKRIERQVELVETLKKYKRGVVRTLLTPDSCCIADATWTTAKIGDLGSFTKGAPLSKADIAPDGTPFILYGELYTTYHEVINAVIRRTQAQPEKQYYSRVGDVIIPTSGETPEEISTAACVMLPDIILAGDLNIFRSSKIDGRIMSYILNHIVNGQIARIAQGKSVVHIQASELSKIEISYPDYNTQCKMISVFETIATRIKSVENELTYLRTMQNALSQQLFI